MTIDWEWIATQREEIAARLFEHVELTGIAVGIGLVISLPLGILAFRRRRLYAPITGVTGILYTIPSLALFGFLIPYTGISFVTAEVGLVGYTLLILIRNTVAGLQGVPDEAVEAARGMGLSDRQLLWRVQLPLAVPAVVTGIRIATVTTIGLVTVTALIGLGGMGHFILLGLRSFGANNTATILGGVTSVALSIAVDVALLGVERVLTPWQQARRPGPAG